MSCWLRTPGEPAWIMGVLNCTPDSFSDGGNFVADTVNAGVDIDIDAAVQHALMMRDQGAVMIDVGGESTRPGANPVSVDEELARVIPVIRALSTYNMNISIDTTKAEVMRQAVAAGASMINDVSALSDDPDALSVVADTGVDVCLMHKQGMPKTMQDNPAYRDVVSEVKDYLGMRIEACLQAGISETSILIDPGIGFGKRLGDNLALIASIETFKKAFGLPVLMGVSRKSFLGMITGSDAQSREIETAAAVSACIFNGCDGVRVHDIASQSKAVAVGSALRDAHLGLS